MGPKAKSSEEEKKQRLYQHMYETGNIYNNATIENAAKPTGISAMVIKGIVQALVDDNLVESDKIGAGTYYWVFKATQSQRLIAKRAALAEAVKAKQAQLKALDADVARLAAEKQQTDESRRLQGELKRLKDAWAEKSGLLHDREEYSWEKYDALCKLLATVQEQANMETDNIFALRKYLEAKFNMARADANKMLGINDKFDYVE